MDAAEAVFRMYCTFQLVIALSRHEREEPLTGCPPSDLTRAQCSWNVALYVDMQALQTLIRVLAKPIMACVGLTCSEN